MYCLPCSIKFQAVPDCPASNCESPKQSNPKDHHLPSKKRLFFFPLRAEINAFPLTTDISSSINSGNNFLAKEQVSSTRLTLCPTITTTNCHPSPKVLS